MGAVSVCASFSRAVRLSVRARRHVARAVEGGTLWVARALGLGAAESNVWHSCTSDRWHIPDASMIHGFLDILVLISWSVSHETVQQRQKHVLSMYACIVQDNITAKEKPIPTCFA